MKKTKTNLPIPPRSDLQEIIRYEPSTGKLYWLERPRRFFKTDHKYHEWNSRYAGRETFNGTNKGGYKRGHLFNQSLLAHRVIWKLVNNEEPENVDHINGIRSDNRLANLRATTRAENAKNQKRYSNNKSGHIGVAFDRGLNRWTAVIQINKRPRYLGSHSTFDEAVTARRAAEIEHGFHPNHGRECSPTVPYVGGAS